MTPLESLPLIVALLGTGVLAFRWAEAKAGTLGAVWIVVMFVGSAILLMDAIRG